MGEHQSRHPVPRGQRHHHGRARGVHEHPPEGKDQSSYRKTCVRCHSNVLNDHPGMGLTDIVSDILDAPFEPKFHIHYAERVWSVKDGLPKFKDMPTEFGGSGETVDE